MTASLWVLVAVAIASSWLAAFAFVRLETALARLHALTYLNVVTGASIALAAFVADGFTNRAFKCLAVWIISIVVGALLSFRVARANHLREGAHR